MPLSLTVVYYRWRELGVRDHVLLARSAQGCSSAGIAGCCSALGIVILVERVLFSRLPIALIKVSSTGIVSCQITES